MSDNEIFRQVKNRASLGDYIESRFPAAKMVKHGATVFFNPAPCCGHNDSFNVKGDASWKCYSCQKPQGLKGGDVFHFAEQVMGMSKHDALRDVAEFVGEPVPDQQQAPQERREKSRAEFIADRCLASPGRVVEWLVEERKIKREVAELAAKQKSIGFNDYTSTKAAPGERGHGGPAAAFIVRPIHPGPVVAVDLRYFDAALNGGIKTMTQGEKDGHGWTSDMKRLLAAETVYLTESPVNALSIESCGMGGKYAAYALRGTANASLIPFEFLRGKQVIYVPDNDPPGDDGYCAGLKAAWVVHERLTALDVSCLLVDISEWGHNDVNDILREQGADELRKVLWKVEQCLIPGMPAENKDNQHLFTQMGKKRIWLPYHHQNTYWKFRVRPDFTSVVDKVEESSDKQDEPPKVTISELAGFRVASISRVSIQSATSTMTGDPDAMPRTLFALSVQTTRHGPRLQRKVIDDEKLHNLDVWRKFGPIWNQSKFLRLINILENAAHLGARTAANFVGLCWRERRLVVNEGPDCYFSDPLQQCPYHSLTFPAGSRSHARRVIEAYQQTFSGNAAAIMLTWALGGHLKAILGFWPHLTLQARKGMGKSTLIKRLERTISFTMFSGQSLQTEFRLLTSVAHTSHPVGWEELSARRQDVIDRAVALLQENYQYTPTRRGSDMTEYLLVAPVLLAGEDTPVKSLIGKIVRANLKTKGPMLPDDLPAFPVRNWLEYLAEQSPDLVRQMAKAHRQEFLKQSRANGEDDGANRMATNYAAVRTAWSLLCEFAEIDPYQGNFVSDLVREMNEHIGETSAEREPWVWIMEKLAGEIARGAFTTYRIDGYTPKDGLDELECLFIRTSDVMHHIESSTALREFWNGLPVKSDRVFKSQLNHAGVIVGEAEKTIGSKRYPRMAVVSLDKLEQYGISMHRPEQSIPSEPGYSYGNK